MQKISNPVHEQFYSQSRFYSQTKLTNKKYCLCKIKVALYILWETSV